MNYVMKWCSAKLELEDFAAVWKVWLSQCHTAPRNNQEDWHLLLYIPIDVFHIGMYYAIYCVMYPVCICMSRVLNTNTRCSNTARDFHAYNTYLIVLNIVFNTMNTFNQYISQYMLHCQYWGNVLACIEDQYSQVAFTDESSNGKNHAGWFSSSSSSSSSKNKCKSNCCNCKLDPY